MSAIHEAQINAFIGSTGSGKSARMKIEIAAMKPSRLLVWDIKKEWSLLGLTAVDSLVALEKALRAKRFAIAFHPIRTTKAMRAQFSTFCKLADGAGNLVCVAEELSDVTLCNWAPEGWSMLTRQGRHSAMILYGTTQSPAAIDKTFLANTTRISCGRLGTDSDAKTLANHLHKPWRELLDLEDMVWINLDKKTHEVTTGTTDKKIIAALKRIT